MSTKLALQMLLDAPCYHFDEVLWRPDHVDAWLARITRQQRIDYSWLYKDYAATMDFPFCLYYKEIAAAFPNHKVLLTVRNPERWYASVQSMIAMLRVVDWLVCPIPYGRKVMAMARYHFFGSVDGAFGGDMSRETALRVFNDHIEQVKSSVAPERLLVFDCSKDGWEPLCKFLGKPVPPSGTPFPHVNDGMRTIRRLAWLHFWRLYAWPLLLGLMLLLPPLLFASSFSIVQGAPPPTPSAVAPPRSLTALLKYPSRGRVIFDSDGVQRVVLDRNGDELSPPNAEEHRIQIFMEGEASGGGGGSSSSSSSSSRLFEDGYEFVNLTHPDIADTLAQLMDSGKLNHGHLSGARSGALSSSPSSSSSSATQTLEDTLASQLEGWERFRIAGGGGRWSGSRPAYAAKCAGFVMRRGGLGGAAVMGSGDGFDRVARRVHIDQDLSGDPLRERGLVWLFRLPGVELLNLWLPLDEMVRLQPLALMSTSTLDPTRDVARFRANSTKHAGGSGGSFTSDRLAVLHRHTGQRFSFLPHMTRGEAIVFPTGRTPHSAFSLPSETPLAEVIGHLTALLLSGEQRDRARSVLCDGEPNATHGDEAALVARVTGACIQREGQEALCEIVDRAVALSHSMCAASQQQQQEVKHEVKHEEELRTLLSLLSRSSVEVRCVTLFPHLLAPLLVTALAGIALVVCACRRVRDKY